MPLWRVLSDWRTSQLCLLSAIVFTGSTVTSDSALAGAFMLTANGLEGRTVLSNRTYSYYLGDAPAGYPPGFTAGSLATPGTFWATSVTDSPSLVSGGRDLSITVQHVAGFPTVGPLITLNFTDLSNAPGAPNAQVFGKAAQEDHGKDFDIARASVVISNAPEPPASGQVVIRASHPTGRVAFVPGYNFGWSLTNGRDKPPLNYTVVPSYRGVDSAGNTITFEGPCTVSTTPGLCATTVAPLAANGRNSGPLPATASTPDPQNPFLNVIGRLSDYEIKAEGSPLSDTTMAFVGDVNGTTSELDLGAAASLFTDTGKIDVPAFDAPNGPLYVAVNLTDWLSAPSAFMPSIGDIFAISGGTNADLPGFLFSTSPIDFVDGQGFVDTAPYAGEVTVRAFIDGEVAVPEPSSLALLAIGCAGGFWWRRRKPR